MDWRWYWLNWEGIIWNGGAVITVMVTFLLGFMIREHYPNVRSNGTTIEENYGEPNPYDHDNCIENFQEVFGLFGIDWFFPVTPCRPVTDGVSFAKAGEWLPPEFDPDEIEYDNEDDPPEDVWYFRYAQPQPPYYYQDYQ